MNEAVGAARSQVPASSGAVSAASAAGRQTADALLGMGQNHLHLHLVHRLRLPSKHCPGLFLVQDSFSFIHLSDVLTLMQIKLQAFGKLLVISIHSA